MATSTTSATSGTGGILQSLGTGSGLDIGSMVTQLVAADMQPDNARIARQSTKVATGLSSIGQLKGALSTFQTALSNINTQTDFQVKSAATGDDKIFTASASNTAAAGVYKVQVQSLAESQQIISTTIAGNGSAAVGTGNLTLSLGDKTFAIKIDDAHSSLNAIRDAINAASDNPGISATIVHSGDTSQLVLNSTISGAANVIKITTDGGDGGLERLAKDETHTTNYTQLQAATDAVVKVAGVTFNSPTNTVTNAIDGITLNLLDAKPDTPISLTIANDNNTVTNRIQSFVSAYNTLQGVVSKLGNYDAASQTAGPMFGDALLNGISGQIRRGLTGSVASATGQYNSLASLGITTNRDGTLALDTTKLTKALNTNFNAVSVVFGAADGVAANLSKFVDAQLAANSGIDARNKTLAAQQKQITNDQVRIAARKQQITDRYTVQFTAMDKALSQMQQTSSFLTQQFAALKAATTTT